MGASMDRNVTLRPLPTHTPDRSSAVERDGDHRPTFAFGDATDDLRDRGATRGIDGQVRLAQNRPNLGRRRGPPEYNTDVGPGGMRPDGGLDGGRPFLADLAV